MLDERFVGTWSFVDAVRVLADGSHAPTYASGGSGQLIYGADGRYVAVLTGPGRKPLTDMDDSSTAALAARATASVERRAELFATMNADWGTWDIDVERGERVAYRLGGALPEWVGTTERRRFSFDGDVLTFRSEPAGDGIYVEVTFRRAS